MISGSKILFLVAVCQLALLQARNIAPSECETVHEGKCMPLADMMHCDTSQYESLLSICANKETFCCAKKRPDAKSVVSLQNWYDTCGENKYGNFSFEKRVIGGTEARQGEIPWQVALLHEDEHVCGGALIDDYHVLTAAHCLFCEGTLPECTLVGIHEVLVGGNSLSIPTANSRRVTVQSVTLHPQYEGSSYTRYDLAILRLSSSLANEINTNEDIMPACSPQTEIDYSGMVCYFSGWGKSGYPFGPKTDNLFYVDLVFMNQQTCCEYHCDSCNNGNCNIYDYNFCAGYEQGGKDACTGDSGGPLVCQVNGKYQLVGVNNWGNGCGREFSPGVYISVTYFWDWINSVISVQV